MQATRSGGSGKNGNGSKSVPTATPASSANVASGTANGVSDKKKRSGKVFTMRGSGGAAANSGATSTTAKRTTPAKDSTTTNAPANANASRTTGKRDESRTGKSSKPAGGKSSKKKSSGANKSSQRTKGRRKLPTNRVLSSFGNGVFIRDVQVKNTSVPTTSEGRVGDHAGGDTALDDVTASETLAENGYESEGSIYSRDEEREDEYSFGGYHAVKIGDLYGCGRYLVVEKLGWGHFSTVWMCIDRHASTPGDPKFVALKVQKSEAHYTEAALDEIQLLTSVDDSVKHTKEMIQELMSKCPEECISEDGSFSPTVSNTGSESNSPPSMKHRIHSLYKDLEYSSHCVKLIDHFRHRGPNGMHVCLVFELLGENLLAVIRHYRHRGLPVPLVKEITRQAIMGLDFLHRKCNIIHTDLKPENLLLMNAPYPVNWDRIRELLGIAAGEDKVIRADNDSLEAAAERLKSENMSGEAKKKLKKKLKKKRQQLRKQPSGDEEDAHNASGLQEEDLAALSENELGESETYAAEYKENHDGETGEHKDDKVAELKDSMYNEAKFTEDKSSAFGEAKSTRVVEKSQSSISIPVTTPIFTNLPKEYSDVYIKVVDLGNACWRSRHFTEDIQTSQYRSPEVITGVKYDTSADIWSLACIVFELLTGDYLFSPAETDDWSVEEDHLAMMIELLGSFPKSLFSGKYVDKYFTSHGDLRNIHNLKMWPLKAVLLEKYRFTPEVAKEISDFLLPMLNMDPKNRATATECLAHPWLSSP